jgi:hypothetical protein
MSTSGRGLTGICIYPSAAISLNLPIDLGFLQLLTKSFSFTPAQPP